MPSYTNGDRLVDFGIILAFVGLIVFGFAVHDAITRYRDNRRMTSRRLRGLR